MKTTGMPMLNLRRGAIFTYSLKASHLHYNAIILTIRELKEFTTMNVKNP